MFELTIGMATYNEYTEIYFTLQALRQYHDLKDTEILVIDNYGCEDTRQLVEEDFHGRYVLAPDVVGTAAPRDLVFHLSQAAAVLCCDCHVLFAPNAITRLKQYYRQHPSSNDLLQGPLVHDDGVGISTHQEPQWHDMMWGTWATDPRGEDPSGQPFEIPMQGLGVFSCRTSAWLGFNPRFRGFGGEEGYIHEKFRKAGGRCLCLPSLRWMHLFHRSAVPYPVKVEDRLRNYIIGFLEVGIDLKPLINEFRSTVSEDLLLAVFAEELFREAAAEDGGFRDEGCQRLREGFGQWRRSCP